MTQTRFDRRTLLRYAGATAVGLTVVGRTLPAAAKAGSTTIGAPVAGPLGDIYGRVGTPRALQLGFTAETTSTRTVTWLTTGVVDPGTAVQFGAVPVDATQAEIRKGAYLDRQIRGTSQLAPYGYGEEGDNHGQPLDGELEVRVHRATMTGLRDGETIGYRVGGGGAWSEVHTFSPTPSSEQGFVFTHMGDHGATAAARRTTAAILARRPDFSIVAGDISYANGDQRIWDRWAGEFEPLSSTVPIVYAPGNHEAKDFGGLTYKTRFSRPDPSAAWFSLDYANVHVVSTTAGALLGDAASAAELVTRELVWLEADLAAAAARRAAGEIDFIVVTQHFPLYTDHRTRGPFSPQLVAAEEHILQRYQVDLVLVGHDHMYQRSKPMAYGVPVGATGGAGYVQIAAGAGGKSLYEFTPIETTELGYDPDQPYQRWSLWSDAWAREFSFVEYAVRGTTITGRAYGWLDAAGQNDIPQDPATYDQQLVPVNADAVDPNLAPRQIDSFELTRKPQALLTQVPVMPRSASVILAGVPEARGIVVRNLVEDCTRHHH